MNMVSMRRGVSVPSLRRNLPGDHDPRAATDRNRSVTESSMRSIGTTLQVFGLLMDHLALRLQNGQVATGSRSVATFVTGKENP